MAIKRSSFSEAVAARDRAVSAFEEMVEDKRLPAELLAEAKAAKARFEAFDMGKVKPKPRALAGETMTLKEAKALVAEATGFARWAGRKLDKDEAEWWSPEHVEATYGVAAPKGGLAGYAFERDCESRSDVSRIELFCAPGHAEVIVCTGRADASSLSLVPNASLGKYLRDNARI